MDNLQCGIRSAEDLKKDILYILATNIANILSRAKSTKSDKSIQFEMETINSIFNHFVNIHNKFKTQIAAGNFARDDEKEFFSKKIEELISKCRNRSVFKEIERDNIIQLIGDFKSYALGGPESSEEKIKNNDALISRLQKALSNKDAKILESDIKNIAESKAKLDILIPREIPLSQIITTFTTAGFSQKNLDVKIVLTRIERHVSRGHDILNGNIILRLPDEPLNPRRLKTLLHVIEDRVDELLMIEAQTAEAQKMLSLQNEILEAHLLIEKTIKKVHDAELEAKKYKESNQTQAKDLDSLKDILNTNEMECTKNYVEITRLSEENNSLKNKINLQKEELDNCIKQLSRGNEESLAVLNEISSLKIVLEKKDLELKRLQNIKQHHEENLMQLNKELNAKNYLAEDLNQAIAKKVAQAEQLNANYQKSQQELNEVKEKYNQMMKSQQENLKDMQLEIDKKNEECEKWIQQDQSNTQTLHQYEIELRQLKDHIKIINDKNEELLNLKIDLETRLDNAAHEKERLALEQEALVSIFERENNQLKNDMQELSCSIQDIKTTNNAKDKEISDLNTQVIDLMKNYELAQNQNLDQQKKIDKLMKDNHQKQELADFEKNNLKPIPESIDTEYLNVYPESKPEDKKQEESNQKRKSSQKKSASLQNSEMSMLKNNQPYYSISLDSDDFQNKDVQNNSNNQ